MKEYWVEGRPATFATSGEIPWRDTILKKVTLDDHGEVPGVQLDFRLPTLAPKGHPLDTDNLCEPVFYSLRKIGYFGGKNANIHWWRASKKKGDPSGVRIMPRWDKPRALREILGTPFFSGVYCGTFPNCASSPGVPAWIGTLPRFERPEPGTRLALSLEFGASKVNLGNIATGTIKSIIDCLYPVIGGRKGAPDDWKIDMIHAEKDPMNRDSKTVSISLWEYGEEVDE